VEKLKEVITNAYIVKGKSDILKELEKLDNYFQEKDENNEE
jgi:hypothetical protein